VLQKAKKHQNMDIDPSTLFLIDGKWGEIKKKFDDN
tara:strand:- start:114 stop:221 length:108 start_codon:yes stop_codon:yes gene_type:complete